MTHVCSRWHKQRVDDLQYAFFNGVGHETWENVWGAWNGYLNYNHRYLNYNQVGHETWENVWGAWHGYLNYNHRYLNYNQVGHETWENVWGAWNGMTQRDAEATRRIGAVMRFVGAMGYLSSPSWVPHTPASLLPLHGSIAQGVSHFPHPERQQAKAGEAFYAVVNRGMEPIKQASLAVPYTPAADSPNRLRFYDVFRGTELIPLRLTAEITGQRYGAAVRV
jgi:hypothetical protein